MHTLVSTPAAEALADPIGSARSAGLHHVTDRKPGIRRLKKGKTFRYLQPDGAAVKDEETLLRIRKLGIPPAWTDVWICLDARGHLQATGRDVRKRKQYRYHPRWREVRDETKFEKVLEFAAALPRIREATSNDLSKHGLPREKVVAAVVRLLEGTLIRVGNEEYARENGSFGLTTMRDRHARIRGATVAFRFRGKSGKEHRIGIHDRRLATIVKRCRDLPGDELFQYLDHDGQQHTVSSSDVNAYLHSITGHEFSAKDFRTWAGTVLATLALRELEAVTKRDVKKNVTAAIQRVAERLGNTPTICRRCYVHPAVIDAYVDGTMLETLKARTDQELTESLHDLRPEEAAVVAFLEERLAREVAERKPGGLSSRLASSVARISPRKTRKKAA